MSRSNVFRMTVFYLPATHRKHYKVLTSFSLRPHATLFIHLGCGSILFLSKPFSNGLQVANSPRQPQRRVSQSRRTYVRFGNDSRYVSPIRRYRRGRMNLVDRSRLSTTPRNAEARRTTRHRNYKCIFNDKARMGHRKSALLLCSRTVGYAFSVLPFSRSAQRPHNSSVVCPR